MAIRTTVITVLIVCAATVMAQTKGTEDSAALDKQRIGQQIFGIGLNASLTSGMGVSFKHHPGKLPFAYQISGGYLQLGENAIYSIGLELQYDINVKSTDRLYAVAAIGHYYYGDSTNTMDFPTRWGAGIGYELSVSRHIGVSVNVMVTGKQFGNNILPLPSAAFHYYFQ